MPFRSVSLTSQTCYCLFTTCVVPLTQLASVRIKGAESFCGKKIRSAEIYWMVRIFTDKCVRVLFFISFFFFFNIYLGCELLLTAPHSPPPHLQRVSSPCDQLQFTFTTSRGDCTAMIVQSRAVIFMEVKVAEDRDNPSLTVHVCACV